MTDWIIPFLCGLGASILSAWGVGGGTLLLLVMTLFLDVDQRTAQGINLLFFLPTAASALVCHARGGYLDKPTLKSAVPLAVAAALAARMEEPLEEHSGLAAADHAERAAVRDGLRRVLEGLSREERRLFTLRFVYGLSSAELGGVLGLSPNGVDARVSRLRKKLKRLLARQGLGLWEQEGDA